MKAPARTRSGPTLPRAGSFSATLILFPVIKILWNRYMKAAMKQTKVRAEKEVKGSPAMTQWDFDLVAMHGAAGE